jgi:hypothetical protein
VAITGALVAAVPAPSVHADGWSLGAGAFEVLSLPSPSPEGFYLSLGAARVMPRGPVVLVPAVAVELSPDTGRWGPVVSLGIDVPVGARVGLDLGLALFTDQPGGAFREALLVAACAPGVSFYLGAWTLSPQVSFLRVLNQPLWAFSPGLVVSRALSP